MAELLEQCQGQQHMDTQDVSVERENNDFSKKGPDSKYDMIEGTDRKLTIHKDVE